jgi:hypothetical protein
MGGDDCAAAPGDLCELCGLPVTEADPQPCDDIDCTSITL